MKPAAAFVFTVSLLLVSCAHRTELQHEITAQQPARCLFRATRNGHVVAFNERAFSLSEKQKYFDQYKMNPNAFIPQNAIELQNSVGFEYTLCIEEPRRTNVLWQFAYAHPFWATGIVVRYPIPHVPAAPQEECETASRSDQGKDIVDVAVSKNGREFVLLLANTPLTVVYGTNPPARIRTSALRNASSVMRSLDDTENIWPAEMSARMMRAATSITFEPVPTIRIASDSRDHNWRTANAPRYTPKKKKPLPYTDADMFDDRVYVDNRAHKWGPDTVLEWRWNGHDWQRIQQR